MLDSVIISDNYIDEILTEIGYPFFDLGEDYKEITEDQIRKFIVIPSLREYYKWNPIKEQSSISTTSTFSLDFPDEDTFGVIQVSLNTASITSGQTNNPIINSRNYQVVSGSCGNRYNYDMNRAYMYKQAYAQSIGSVNKSVKYDVDFRNKKVSGYTNVSGIVTVTWAKYDNNFDNIPLTDIDDVLNYCKGKLDLWFTKVYSKQNSNLANEFNWEQMQEDGKELIETVLEKWQTKTKSVIMFN